MAQHRPIVTVYTRTGCGLCAVAEELVASQARRRPPWRPRPRVSFVDVDEDEGLVRRYGVRVPVVVIDGREAAELEVSKGQVRQALRAAWRSSG